MAQTVTAKGPNGQTALHLAVANGNIKPVQLLSDNGAGVASRDERAWTPLPFAADAPIHRYRPDTYLWPKEVTPNGREQKRTYGACTSPPKMGTVVIQWIVDHWSRPKAKGKRTK